MSTLTAKQRLQEAECAYHALQIGKGVVEVQFSDDRRVEFRKTDLRQLRMYIDSLRVECGLPALYGRRRPGCGVFPV